MLLAGWREWVRFPALLPRPLRAKMDSGARSSTLAATHIRLRGGEVRFRPVGFTDECRAVLADERWITDAGGHRELRPVIATTLLIGPHALEVEVTLTQRKGLRYRVLVGRTAMAGHFVVDPGASYLLGKPA